MKHLRDVRTRHLHALSKLRLRDFKLLHPDQNAAKERRTDFIYCIHSLQPTSGSLGGRKLRVEELGVEESWVLKLGVGELAGAGAFQDALQ